METLQTRAITRTRRVLLLVLLQSVLKLQQVEDA